MRVKNKVHTFPIDEHHIGALAVQNDSFQKILEVVHYYSKKYCVAAFSWTVLL